jgi:hypothetical protein
VGAAQRTGEILPASVAALSEQLERLTTPEAVLNEGLGATYTLLGFDAALILERRGDVFKPTKLAGTIPDAAQALLDNLDYSVHDGLASRAMAQQTTVWEDDYPSNPAAPVSGSRPDLKVCRLPPSMSAQS